MLINDSVVYLIDKYGMGNDPRELQLKLIESHLSILELENYLPRAIFLYSEGIKLAIDGSPVIEIRNRSQVQRFKGSKWALHGVGSIIHNEY